MSKSYSGLFNRTSGTSISQTESTVYHVILCHMSDATTQNIKLIAEIAKCNYNDAIKLIETAPTEIFSGTAVELKPITKKLETANIEYIIVPAFQY